MSTDAKMIAQRIMECLDQRDLDGVLALCADNTVWHGFAPQPLDNAGYRQAISVFLDAYPDSRFPIDDVIAEGNKVAVRHRLCGTHRSAFQGIPPTGKPVNVRAIVTFHIANGKVAETWLDADLLGMLQQLGAIPMPS